MSFVELAIALVLLTIGNRLLVAAIAALGLPTSVGGVLAALAQR